MAPPMAHVIAIDAMGGDSAPGPEVEGAAAAVRDHGARVILLGDESRLRAELQRLGVSHLGIPIHHCPEVITMDDHPGQAVRKKRLSSMRVGFELVRSGEASAVVSAGNSGAMLACGLFVLGRVRGLDRPGIAVTMPTLQPGLFGAPLRIGECVLLDTGANVDVKPQTLAQFAVLGATFAKQCTSCPRSRPSVGLLSNGEESSKGTPLLRQTHALLIANPSPAFEYVGYVEGRDLFQFRRSAGSPLRDGGLDVVVTDGFTGNVVLKTAEGAGRFLADLLRSEVKRSLLAQLGALLMMPALQSLKRVVDIEGRGGAPLLGVNGVAMICHGRASARAITRAIQVAQDHVQSGLIEATKAAVSAHRFAEESASSDPENQPTGG
jgi:glycerol-3-phosphate acyltransferase PlsX